jgi:hypothetical protein
MDCEQGKERTELRPKIFQKYFRWRYTFAAVFAL